MLNGFALTEDGFIATTRLGLKLVIELVFFAVDADDDADADADAVAEEEGAPSTIAGNLDFAIIIFLPRSC